MQVILPNADSFKDMTWEKARSLLVDDLQRIALTINDQWAASHKTDGTQTLASTGDRPWVDVPFNNAMYSTNGGGSITMNTAGSDIYVYRYVDRYNTLQIQLGLNFTVNNGATTEIFVQLPSSYVPRPYVTRTFDLLTAATGTFNGGGTSGVMAGFIQVSPPAIVLERADGTLAAGFPAAQIFCRIDCTIPLTPQAFQNK